MHSSGKGRSSLVSAHWKDETELMPSLLKEEIASTMAIILFSSFFNTQKQQWNSYTRPSQLYLAGYVFLYVIKAALPQMAS